MTAQEIAALTAARSLKLIGMEANAAFIDRHEAIDALLLGMACGEHVIFLGPPGTAKSSIVRSFADAMGLPFFRRVLNPDTTREDVVGPLSPAALRDGRWDRQWSGLATSTFALLDEIGKASNQVLNMLLDAMEERRVTSGDTDRCIPLHVAVGASNETLGPDVEAIWDRFTIRVVLHSITSASDMQRLLTDAWKRPTLHLVEQAGLDACRKQCREMAAAASPDVVAKLVALWGEYATHSGERISDRRWMRCLLVAAGRALLDGRTTILVSDLSVCKHLLWSNLDERDAIAAWIDTSIDEELAAYRDIEALLAELENDGAAAVAGGNLNVQALVSLRCTKLIRQTVTHSGAQWDALRTRIQAVQNSL